LLSSALKCEPQTIAKLDRNTAELGKPRCIPRTATKKIEVPRIAKVALHNTRYLPDTIHLTQDSNADARGMKKSLMSLAWNAGSA
jgi:hypothetical protein